MGSMSRFIAGKESRDKEQVLHRVQGFYTQRNWGGGKGSSQ